MCKTYYTNNIILTILQATFHLVVLDNNHSLYLQLWIIQNHLSSPETKKIKMVNSTQINNNWMIRDEDKKRSTMFSHVKINKQLIFFT